MKHVSYFCKRVLDLSLVIPILIFLSPALLCLCAGYAVSMIFFPEDRGPIFHRNFRKTRGRLFLIYKKGKGVDYTFKDELMSGLTGYYQLNKDYRALDDYMQFVLEGVELDRRYYDKVKQISCFKLLMPDISIIVRSITVVVRAEGI